MYQYVLYNKTNKGFVEIGTFNNNLAVLNEIRSQIKQGANGTRRISQTDGNNKTPQEKVDEIFYK